MEILQRVGPENKPKKRFAFVNLFLYIKAMKQNMKKTRYRKVDQTYLKGSSLKKLREFMGVPSDFKFKGNWAAIMGVLEYLADDGHCSWELSSSHTFEIVHPYKKFKQTYGWFDYKKREDVVLKVILDFIEWYTSDKPRIIAEYLNENK